MAWPTACNAHGQQAATLTELSAASSGQWRMESPHSIGCCTAVCSKCTAGQHHQHGQSWHYYSTHIPPVEAAWSILPLLRHSQSSSSHSSQAAPCLPQPCPTATISMQDCHGLELRMLYASCATGPHLTCHTLVKAWPWLQYWPPMLSQHILVGHEHYRASSVLCMPCMAHSMPCTWPASRHTHRVVSCVIWSMQAGIPIRFRSR